jgi:gluconolactonase
VTAVVATGVAIPEGPVVLRDGRIAFVEQVRGRLSALRPAGAVETIAEGPGSPNGATLGSDDCIYVTQNGGVVDHWRAPQRTDPGIQRITLGGAIQTIATHAGDVKLEAPNDLCFGPDGRLYFTDPAHGYNPDAREPGRLCVLGPAGCEVLLDLYPAYPNGIGFSADGRLLWVESYERTVCMLENGERVEICRLPDGHIPDGFAVATDGRIFIATATSHGVTVLSPDGEVLDHLMLAHDSFASNCCFDGSALYVTDFGPGGVDDPSQGKVWRVDTDAQGFPLHAGAV